MLRWMAETTTTHPSYHKAYLNCLEVLKDHQLQDVLDRKTKIAFTLMHEFGSRLSPSTIHMTLVGAVEKKLLSQ